MPAEVLQDKQVYHGGPCGRGSANVLHSCGEVEGAAQIVAVSVFSPLRGVATVADVEQYTQLMIVCSL